MGVSRTGVGWNGPGVGREGAAGMGRRVSGRMLEKGVECGWRVQQGSRIDCGNGRQAKVPGATKEAK